MTRIVVDTNILIDHSKGRTGVLKELFNLQELGEIELFITPVIISEFFADKELVNKKNEQKARAFINLFNVLNLTKVIGFKAGEFLRQGSMGHIADALIAASCVEGRMKLATRNKRHFKNVKSLSLYD